MLEPIKDCFSQHKNDAYFFVEHLRGAEFHWFFVQAVNAIEHELYLPAVSSLFNGVEATLRVTLQQIYDSSGSCAPSPYRVLSNTLIRDAYAQGMPVEKLAFPGEIDFFEKLRSEKSGRVNVEIVRLRNDICHGNVFEFINRELGESNYFFTPECLRDLAKSLLETSRQWTYALGNFRKIRLHR